MLDKVKNVNVDPFFIFTLYSQHSQILINYGKRTKNRRTPQRNR